MSHTLCLLSTCFCATGCVPIGTPFQNCTTDGDCCQFPGYPAYCASGRCVDVTCNGVRTCQHVCGCTMAPADRKHMPLLFPIALCAAAAEVCHRLLILLMAPILCCWLHLPCIPGVLQVCAPHTLGPGASCWCNGKPCPNGVDPCATAMGCVNGDCQA